MEFNKRLYNLRKQKTLSQEELAHQLNVSRQTISKWESGDSTPDMEKIILLSQIFEITLDELVLGKMEAPGKETFLTTLEEKALTPTNKKKAKQALKIAGIIVGILVAIDILSMIIYFFLYGIPS